MIWVDGKEPQEIALPPGENPHLLRRPERGDPLALRPHDGGNELPAEAGRLVEHLPAQLHELLQGIDQGVALLLSQGKKVSLEAWVVQIKSNLTHGCS